MNINKINTNLSFKGYENLISYSHSVDSNNVGLAYMAMKLNNENGQKDLEIWHDIQRGLFNENNPSDYLILTKAYMGDIESDVLNNYSINLDKIKNKKEEIFIMRAYTLLASLTRRIIYTDHHPENAKIYLTLSELIKILNKQYKDSSKVFLLSNLGANKSVKHYKTAELVNQKIAKKMAAYLKL